MGLQPEPLKRRAFTLVEVLVAMSLLIMVMVMLSWLLHPALKISSRTTERVALLQRGMLCLDKLRSDLQRSDVEGITFYTPAPNRFLLAAHRLDTVSAAGDSVMEPELVLYEWDSGRLRRGLFRPPVPSGFTVTPQSPNLAAAEAMLVQTTENRVLAEDVTQFQVSDADAANPTLQLPLAIDLRLERDVPGNDREVVQLSRKVFLRNI